MAAILTALMLLTGCAAAQELQTTFFDVGKADAMLITTPGGVRVMIDAATNKEGKKLAERLKAQGVTRIDVLIVTHYDKDHVGGADKILENFEVGAVIMPVYDKASKQYTQFEEALAACPPQAVYRLEAAAQTSFETSDGVQFVVTAAHETDYGADEENDFSLAVRMTYGETKFLFAGDAESARQFELLAEGDVACDVLKTPYHGRYEKSSPAFLATAAPKIAYICDAKDEPASDEVIRILQNLGAQVYCAKDDGDVTVISDGTNVWAE